MIDNSVIYTELSGLQQFMVSVCTSRAGIIDGLQRLDDESLMAIYHILILAGPVKADIWPLVATCWTCLADRLFLQPLIDRP
jgi:hypothetical protein